MDRNIFAAAQTGGVYMNTCPHCGKETLPGAVFCIYCGKKIPAASAKQQNAAPYTCPRCGAPVSFGQMHCPYCKAVLLTKPPNPDGSYSPDTCILCGNTAPPGEAYCLECQSVMQSMGRDTAPEDAPAHKCIRCGKMIWTYAAYCPECTRVRNVLGNTEEIRIPYIHFCPHCGGKVTPATVYCPACGKDVGVFPEAEPPFMEQNAFDSDEEALAWMTKVGIVYFIVIFLFILLVASCEVLFAHFLA